MDTQRPVLSYRPEGEYATVARLVQSRRHHEPIISATTVIAECAVLLRRMF